VHNSVTELPDSVTGRAQAREKKRDKKGEEKSSGTSNLPGDPAGPGLTTGRAAGGALREEGEGGAEAES